MYLKRLLSKSCLALLVFFTTGASDYAVAEKQGKLIGFAGEHIPGQLIVKFKDFGSESARLSYIKQIGARVLHEYKTGRAVLIEVPVTMGKSLQSIASALSSNDAVEYVEANSIIRVLDSTPNDPDFDKLYGMHNTGATGGVRGADIDALKAWDITRGSRSMVVAVIDTGIDGTHPDLAANMWINSGETGLDEWGRDRATNGIDDDGNGYVDDWRGWDFVNNDNNPFDDNGHGTHCAGTIGAVGDNGIGVVGVNWEVSLVGLKFLSGSGSGSLDGALRAIEYATTMGFQVLSNSWGGGGHSETLQAAIQRAADRGLLFVAAAGNTGGNNNDTSPHYPSSYEVDNVIAVAATDSRDRMASFSCFGANSVDLGAPGVDILSTWPNNGYKSISGTSMATPHVAGAAALVWSYYPDATYRQIKERLLNTVDSVSSLRGKTLTGGRLNVANALEDDRIPPSPVAALEISEVSTTGFTLAWAASGDDGDEGVASTYLVRRAQVSIDSEEDWNAATPVPVEVRVVEGGLQTSIEGLPINSAGYVAIRAVDNVGNVSDLGATVAYAVLPVEIRYQHEADSLEGVDAQSPWGIEDGAFSDSPGGKYRDSVNTSLQLLDVPVGPDAVLAFDTKFDIESRYDFGFVEISTDEGATWTELTQYTGASPWQNVTIPLQRFVNTEAVARLRFRLKTDNSVVRDGWFIDNIVVFGAQR